MVEQCSECKDDTGLITDNENGEVVCTKCGLVVFDQAINSGLDYRAYDIEEQYKKAHTGNPATARFVEKGLPTTISKISKDALGKSLPQRTVEKMSSLERLQRRTIYHKNSDRNLQQALTEINRIVDRLHIGRTIGEETAILYRRILVQGLVRGRSIASTVAACVYIVCRKAGTPQTLKNFSDVCGIRLKDISRSYRLIMKNSDISVPLPTPQFHVAKLASRLNIDMKTQMKTYELLDIVVSKKENIGKGPVSLAAAALYIACILEGYPITQHMISQVANITSVTLRARYKGIKDIIKLDFNKKEIQN